MGNLEVQPARRRGDKKSGGFPLAWVVFGGATSPVAPPAIWTASASSISVQHCLHGRQKTSFYKGQLCTLSLQRQVAHTSDPGGFSRGDQTPAFSPRSTQQMQSSLGWTAGVAARGVQNGDEVPVPRTAARKSKRRFPWRPMGLPTWCLSGVEGEVDLLEDLSGKKQHLHFYFSWQLQLEKSYCCRISNVLLPFWSVMHIEHMSLFSCPLFNLNFSPPWEITGNSGHMNGLIYHFPI